MAESTPAAEVGPTAGLEPTLPGPGRGTTRLGRVSAALAWFAGLWFLAYGLLYVPLLVLGALLVWLGVGAWRGRRRRTIGLAVLSLAAALWYPGAAWWRWTHTDQLGDIGYPGLWAAMLAVQSAVLVTIALTALLSLRRATALPAPTITTAQP